MNIDKLLKLYLYDHPKAIIAIRKSQCEWIIWKGNGKVTKYADSKSSVIKAALTYGSEIILVEQYGENGYEEPDINQIWDDETMGY